MKLFKKLLCLYFYCGHDLIGKDGETKTCRRCGEKFHPVAKLIQEATKARKGFGRKRYF